MLKAETITIPQQIKVKILGKLKIENRILFYKIYFITTQYVFYLVIKFKFGYRKTRYKCHNKPTGPTRTKNLISIILF